MAVELEDLEFYTEVEDVCTLDDLRALRKKYNIRLNDISDDLLMSPSYYSAVESGRRKTYEGKDLEEFIEDVQDSIYNHIKKRKEDSYDLSKNLDVNNLVWQVFTPKLFEEAVTRLQKGENFYKVVTSLEVDELELESKLKKAGLGHLALVGTNF